MKIISTFSKRLKDILEFRDIKPSKLSELTNINKSTISQYLNGEYEPKRNRIEIFSKILNVNEAWLMGYDVPMEREIKNATDIKSFQMFRINTKGLNEADIEELKKELEDYTDYIREKIIKNKKS